MRALAVQIPPYLIRNRGVELHLDEEKKWKVLANIILSPFNSPARFPLKRFSPLMVIFRVKS